MYLRGYGLDCGENCNARSAEPNLREQINGVLHDVAFGIEIGKDVDSRIGDEQRLGIARHVHDEDMADPPLRAQAGLARRHLAHELVRVQAALHQELAFGLMDQLDRLSSRRVAVGHIDDLETADVETMLTSEGRNLDGRSNQDRFDDTGFRRLDGAAQRRFFAGVHDDGRRWGDLLCPGDQPLVLRGGGSPTGPIAAMLPISLSFNMEP
jgi:hypothetical protein